jgi:hypothetical protein
MSKTHKPQAQSGIKSKFRSAMSSVKNKFHSLSKEWLAVFAIVFLIGMGVFYDLGQRGTDQFRGELRVPSAAELYCYQNGMTYNGTFCVPKEATEAQKQCWKEDKILNPTTNTCQECAADEYLAKNVDGSKECLKKLTVGGCPSDQNLVNGKCVDKSLVISGCPSDQMLVNGRCENIQLGVLCKAGEIFTNGQCQTPLTPIPTIPTCSSAWQSYDSAKNACVDRCDQSSIWVPERNRCERCISGAKNSDNTCKSEVVPAPIPTCSSAWQSYDPAKNACVDRCASSSQIWNGSTCTTCPFGSKYTNSNTCVPVQQESLNLQSPSENASVYRSSLENGNTSFSWNTISNVVDYRFILRDSAGTTVLDSSISGTSYRPYINVRSFIYDSRSWTWQVGARKSDNTYTWSNSRALRVLEDVTQPTPANSVSIRPNLSVDAYGEVDADITLRNNSSSNFTSSAIIFRATNLTDRLDPVDFYYDRSGKPVFKVTNLAPRAEISFRIDNLPNSSASGTKLFEFAIYSQGQILATERVSIYYDNRNYDPFRPRDDRYAPAGREVQLRGFVEKFGANNFILVDGNRRMLAYLVAQDSSVRLSNFLTSPVLVNAVVERYSCEGSTLRVKGLTTLSGTERHTNTNDELHRAGVICFTDIDTRPVFNPETGKIQIMTSEKDPWYLAFVIDMFDRGIMKGDRNGVFDPARNISIAETVKMAVMSAKIPVQDEIVCLDSRQPWYCEVMKAARSLQLLGNAALNNPERPATRAEVVELVMKAFRVEPDFDPRGGFPDIDYSNRNSGFIEAARKLRIISGYPDGTFKPNSQINRAEVAKIYSNAIRILAEGRAPISNR